MADLNVLGALSGIGKSTIKGLSMLRDRDREQEEQERQEREKRINFYRTYLPDMDEAQAKMFLGRDENLGDDDKQALMAIAGLRKKQEPTIDLSSVEGQLQQLRSSGEAMSPEEAYNIFEGNLLQKGLPKAQAEQWLTRARRMLNIEQKDVGAYSFDKFLTDWQDPQVDNQGLTKMAKDIGHPEWVDYVGGTGKQPGKTPKTPTGRTPEEVIDDQSRIIGRRIRDLDTRMGTIQTNMSSFGSDHEDFPKWAEQLNELKADRDYLREKEGELGEEDAKPFKDLNKVLTRPRTKKKEKPKPKEKLGSAAKHAQLQIKRKKAMRMLREGGYKITVERVNKIIEQGLVD